MTAPEPSSGVAEFGLDLDKAREAVTALEEVYSQLADLLLEAHRVARSERTAHDAVSEEAFLLLTQKAVGLPGSLGSAVEAGMVHVEGLIDQMRADIQAQREIDANGANEIEQL